MSGLTQRAGPVLAWCSLVGAVFWLTANMMVRDVVFTAKPTSLEGAVALIFRLSFVVGITLVLGSIVVGSLVWAHLGAHPAVRGYRVATVGGILSLFLAPLLTLAWWVISIHFASLVSAPTR